MNTFILITLISTNSVHLAWETTAGGHYRLSSASSITSGNWSTITNITGNGKVMKVALQSTSTERYFRVTARTNPLAGKSLYHETNTPAARQVKLWETSQPENSALIKKIADQPTSVWINSSSDIAKIGQTFAKCGTNIPTFVLYNIYQRDYQGGFSAGGAPTPTAYTNFINSCIMALKAKPSIVILEPDTLAALDGLPAEDKEMRLDLMFYAIHRLSTLAHTTTYADGGHPHWHGPEIMASRLKRVGIHKIQGFALNVSNFAAQSTCISYGTAISRATDNAHFVIDTSRNGRGPAPDFAWCNPPHAGLGPRPTVETGNSLVDAYLYIKYPGESDGNCNGWPLAGVWHPPGALELCKKASF